MKKIISLILSAVMCAAVLTGCTFFERDLERDYARVIASIEEISQTFTVERDKLDENGNPEFEKGFENIYDEKGKPLHTVKERHTFNYTSPAVNIYKSQLVNYVNNYGGQYINSYGYTLERTVETLLDMLVSSELVLVEADKFFHFGEMYWTEDDVLEIQTKVYAAIDDQIFDVMNEVLDRKEEPKMEKPQSAPSDPAPT